VDEAEALHRAHDEIPLARSHGVFAASSALVPRTRVTKRTMFANFQRHLITIPNFEDVVHKEPATRANSRPIEKIEKRYQAIRTDFDLYHLHRPVASEMEDYRVPAAQQIGDHGWGIWFVAHGDRERVEDLLGDLRYIGAKRMPILKPEIIEAAPTDLPGLLGHDGTVLRPVPCASDFAPEKFTRSFERYRPPYWHSSLAADPVLCYVPPQTMWPNEGRIKQMIGVD
jgi:hypothetical protein